MEREGAPLFCFILFFITIDCDGFYISFLSSSLLSTLSYTLSLYNLLSTPSLTLSLPFTPPVNSFHAPHTLYLPCSNVNLQLPTPTVLHYTVSSSINHFLSSLPLCLYEFLQYAAISPVRIHGPPLSHPVTAQTNTLLSLSLAAPINTLFSL